MAHTEEQARKLWCPMVRHFDGENITVTGNREAISRDDFGAENGNYNKCIASECALWRWHHEISGMHKTTTSVDGETRYAPPEGYCGGGGPW